MKLIAFFLAPLLTLAVIANTATAADADAGTKNLRFLKDDAEPEAGAPHRLLATGASGTIGNEHDKQYLEIIEHDGWAHVTSVPEEATVFVEYLHNGNTYYRAKTGKWSNKYLSYNNKGYMGMYKWISATQWEERNGCLTKKGKTWKTFEYSSQYAMLDDTVHSGYEDMCLELN